MNKEGAEAKEGEEAEEGQGTGEADRFPRDPSARAQGRFEC